MAKNYTLEKRTSPTTGETHWYWYCKTDPTIGGNAYTKSDAKAAAMNACGRFSPNSGNTSLPIGITPSVNKNLCTCSGISSLKSSNEDFKKLLV